ncbi:hypothetical protein RhiirA1_427411 [Rhizophagus irregularis]|uniref:Uncharacterized protein n=4 Tax=Rhizophagus irregularis TaxID=588596 RepID=A0A2N0R695_9GLOM|nr:hypothetical protein GLOIN_2v1598043 [Rhizophagus irregularis DAOM 181602=DAOM 197198]EXX67593.1 hypothetical protein RirG_112930 [Rhizophagus irregularis DAOM 197198w]PKC58831.1 hypothetical protein RhiirA1_427411 [Rhizophagus irregularis]EXX72082.1 hypothetical protein RirG_072680 [Rhizophagus irregularis DAOM 197198w]EXX78445.1 hypothetical protein RirG_014830 [Rhizophagus irregularis DAOM 197198w]POG72261.1 hypothetical protein GLOIN_2v1598043 [Rhizophagus irregularis DAOM 181602=DAOM 1|eukprot:XP_025179127.1 hypothetical protein GLOIN_2v1598043 [Rhizophagus irregularis DAOM 181602=DAOM 197198]
MSSSFPSLPSAEEIEKITDTRDLIYRLKQSNLGLTENDFEVLKYHKIIGRTFLMLTEEKLENRGEKLGPSLNIAYSVNKILEQDTKTSKSSKNKKRNIEDDLEDIDILREEFREIVEEKFKTTTGLTTKINYSLLLKDVHSVCGEDTISGTTLRDFFLNNTNLSKHTYPIVRQWVEHKKRIYSNKYKAYTFH